MSEPIHIISLGAGVQSSTMALMAAAGEITPMPTCAVFADTRDEPKEVMTWLSELTKILPFPVHIVSNGRLSSTFGEKFCHLPTYKLKKNGDVSMGKRQCTRHFKLKPIQRFIKSLGATAKHPVVCWVGITTDEISRVKPSRVKYIENRWPFIEMELSRNSCVEWLKRKGLKAPKSACYYCPLHSDATWRALAQSEMIRAIKVDAWFNKNRNEFLHRSCKPLSEVDFSTEEERGQLNMFNNECEGMCGV